MLRRSLTEAELREHMQWLQQQDATTAASMPGTTFSPPVARPSSSPSSPSVPSPPPQASPQMASPWLDPQVPPPPPVSPTGAPVPVPTAAAAAAAAAYWAAVSSSSPPPPPPPPGGGGGFVSNPYLHYGGPSAPPPTWDTLHPAPPPPSFSPDFQFAQKLWQEQQALKEEQDSLTCTSQREVCLPANYSRFQLPNKGKQTTVSIGELVISKLCGK